MRLFLPDFQLIFSENLQNKIFLLDLIPIVIGTNPNLNLAFMLQSIVRAAWLLWLLLLPANGLINNKEIDSYFASVLKGENYTLSSEAIKGTDGKKILILPGQNIENTNPQVRYKIIDLVKRKALAKFINNSIIEIGFSL